MCAAKRKKQLSKKDNQATATQFLRKLPISAAERKKLLSKMDNQATAEEFLRKLAMSAVRLSKKDNQAIVAKLNLRKLTSIGKKYNKPPENLSVRIRKA
ncbi:MAG TPA: hypothetical protein VFR24_28105 [Candidatus Angelobacter sp.]|nr:hypothetical protein [Candidatus Angelobacter sp.]